MFSSLVLLQQRDWSNNVLATIFCIFLNRHLRTILTSFLVKIIYYLHLASMTSVPTVVMVRVEILSRRGQSRRDAISSRRDCLLT